MPKDPKHESTEFDSVMQELESFSKSYAPIGEEQADDKPKPKAKAKKEEVVDEENEGNGDEHKEELPLNKSVNTDEGQAMDAEAFMGEFLQKSKSLLVQVSEKASAESLKGATLLAKALVAQGRLTQALAEEVAGLREAMDEQGQKPRLRKSVVNIQDRQHGQNLNEKQDEETPASAVLAKCNGEQGLVAKGLVTPSLVSQIQYYANRNQSLPANLKHLEQYA